MTSVREAYTPQAGLTGEAPHGYDHLSRSVVLTRRDFDAAARDLFEWQMHARAGLDVLACEVPLEVGTVVLMRWRLGALSISRRKWGHEPSHTLGRVLLARRHGRLGGGSAAYVPR